MREKTLRGGLPPRLAEPSSPGMTPLFRGMIPAPQWPRLGRRSAPGAAPDAGGLAIRETASFPGFFHAPFLLPCRKRDAANAPGSRPFFLEAGGFRGKPFDRTLFDAPVAFSGAVSEGAQENRRSERWNGVPRVVRIGLDGQDAGAAVFNDFRPGRFLPRIAPPVPVLPFKSRRSKSFSGSGISMPLPRGAALPGMDCRPPQTPPAHPPHPSRGFARILAVHGCGVGLLPRRDPPTHPPARARHWRARPR